MLLNPKLLLFSLLLFSCKLDVYSQVNQPINNFEILWKTFDERYANFELKGIDWDSVHTTYKPRVTAQTEDRELFSICCEMLQTLSDGHVSIEAEHALGEWNCGPPYDFSLEIAFPSDSAWTAFEAVMDKYLRAQGFSVPIYKELSEDTHFQYRLSDSMGYLRLDEMTEDINFLKFPKAMDEAISAFQSKSAIIIDLRFNGGGFDHTSHLMARRLIQEETFYLERRRRKGTSSYTSLKTRSIKPTQKGTFSKSIVILTSDYTASAAEVFLLLMKDLEHVTLIGEASEGIFSDTFEFSLPNKWNISLSHQQYFSQDTINYEGKGIPVDIQVKNSPQDLLSEKDSVIETAIKYLSGKMED
ncbi:MAG: S41 family peptidase [Bacteroidota bacterium]